MAKCADGAVSARRWVLAASVVAGVGVAASGVTFAQQPKKQPAAPAAAAPAAAAPAKQSAWVKLCEKAQLARRGADGKEVKEEKNICLTHHERLDGNTGMVMVSAALRQIDGVDKQHLMIMVPLGMAIPPGIKAAVYDKGQWEKAQKNEKFDEKALKPMDLKYTLCHPAGCTAEVEAPKEWVDQMKTGGGIMVLAMNAAAQPIAFPVPLDGFTTTHAGAPVDPNVYGKARGELMKQIAQRREELIKQMQQQQQQPPQAAPAKKP